MIHDWCPRATLCTLGSLVTLSLTIAPLYTRSRSLALVILGEARTVDFQLPVI